MRDRIAVCVCTYHRNATLLRLLRSLAVQETHGHFTFSVVVVDNDPAGPAREDVLRVSAELGIEVAYDVEPERTIPAARNHALRMAQGPFIGIIDDDEFPPPHWLITLYENILAFGVDGALGPVYPFFEQPPPDWVTKSGLYDWPHMKTGTRLHWQQTRTSNVLLKKSVFEEGGLAFDPSFKTGGSDKDFFRRAMALGYQFIAVAEAPVYEIIPPERWSKRYFVRRALVNGFNSWKYTAAEGRPLSAVVACLRSAASLGAHAFALPVAAILGPHVWMRTLEKGAYHLSRLAAAFGIELRKKRDF